MTLRNRLYYWVKPFVPLELRTGVRRWLALRKRERVRDVWPILPGSNRAPEGWAGWPNGKQFALVLTHDVEGQLGLDKCRQLMRLEMSLGFRSSFNLVPEGEYRVPCDLRQELKQNGFEVGVHDLNHDGKLYSSRSEFSRKAARIREYLKGWGAVGFRSGFMLHELDWIHELNVQYDASTFDTDPFEPQNDGGGTIFPFWVPRPRTLRMEDDVSSGSSGGYVELSYTLPQDSTVFLLLRERPDIWTHKLNWIAEHGGMALVNVHPDYIQFGGEPGSSRTFPVELYSEFLKTIRSKYEGAYWHVTASELASWYRGTPCVNQSRVLGSGQVGIVSSIERI